MDRLHVERNSLVGMNYLGIIDMLMCTHALDNENVMELYTGQLL